MSNSLKQPSASLDRGQDDEELFIPAVKITEASLIKNKRPKSESALHLTISAYPTPPVVKVFNLHQSYSTIISYQVIYGFNSAN